jgi:hypothetical protein
VQSGLAYKEGDIISIDNIDVIVVSVRHAKARWDDEWIGEYGNFNWVIEVDNLASLSNSVEDYDNN